MIRVVWLVLVGLSLTLKASKVMAERQEMMLNVCCVPSSFETKQGTKFSPVWQ